ncbi:MAG: restriction endonuclease subunit S [Flavobacteriaceae bacterium]|nr:restriction endonuclease subunit S [Flavobacteriaceae bacterium]
MNPLSQMYVKVFHVTSSKSGIPFISRTEKNNGVSSKVELLENVNPIKNHTLTVALSGSVLETFYQKEEYYTAYHVGILYPKEKMTEKEMLIYSVFIRSNSFRYSFGRQANKTLSDIFIPDLEEVSKICDSIKFTSKIIDKHPFKTLNLKLNTSNWRWIKIPDIFHIKGSTTSSYIYLKEKGQGKFPYITTRATNNGVRDFFNHYTEKGNVLTIDSAVVGYCSFQNLDFSASDHVEIFRT